MRAHGPIHVRGLGLSCALGAGARACADALESGAENTVEVALDELVEAVRLRYYRIDDGAALFRSERLAPLIARTAREAIESAELSRADLERLPLFLGTSSFSFGMSDAQHGAVVPQIGIEDLAGIVRERAGAGGESFGFNTACTASANALMVASRMVALGRFRHALVLGVELASLTTLAGFSGLQLVADAVRPFDRRRGGIVLGESVGAVVLSAQAGALRTTLVAGASNVDTYSVTAANPDGSTIAAVQLAALRHAGVGPAEVRGIKAHGTASPMNDTGEAAGILRVFESPPPVCALKAALGHTLGACGASEFVLMASALERGFFPGTPGFDELDPELGLEPARAPREARSGHYLLNYFGFGGNNASLVLHCAR